MHPNTIKLLKQYRGWTNEDIYEENRRRENADQSDVKEELGISEREMEEIRQ